MWTIPLRWEMLRNQEARASHWLQYWQRLNAMGTYLCNVSQVEISKSGIKITLYILILLVHAHTCTQLYNMILTFPACHAHWYFLFCYFNQDPLFRFQISLVERHDHMKETRIRQETPYLTTCKQFSQPMFLGETHWSNYLSLAHPYILNVSNAFKDTLPTYHQTHFSIH